MDQQSLFPTSATSFDHKKAWEEKRKGQEQAERYLERWRLIVLGQLKSWFLHHIRLITADDITEVCGLPTEVDGQHTNNGVGATITAFHKLGYLKPAGYCQSSRVTNHGRVLREWEIQESVLDA